MTAAPVVIVHVIHHLVIGGMENGVVNLINHLPRERFRHIVVCVEDYSDFRDRIADANVEVVALHRSKIGAWQMRWLLWRLFRRVKPAIVHTRNLSGLDALLPALLAGARTIHSEHGFDVGDLTGRSFKSALLRRFHAPLVRRYVTVSRDLGNLMINRWGIAPRRITQIYNGVDVDKFRPCEPRRHNLLPPELRSRKVFVVGTVGRLRPIKDQATLVRAFAGVIDRSPHWREKLRLIVVGDGPLLLQLRELADELGVGAQVWFPGACQDVSTLMQAMDLFVLPSLNEGVSNTLLEAMATGIPVLASAVGGNVELVEEGVVGAMFRPGDHLALGCLIDQYVGNAELCVEQGTAARNRVLQRFSLSHMVASYQQVYETA